MSNWKKIMVFSGNPPATFGWCPKFWMFLLLTFSRGNTTNKHKTFHYNWQDLVKANDEFAAEVERLYKVEEEQVNKIDNLENKIKQMEEKFISEKSKLKHKHHEEQNKSKAEIDQLKKSLNTSNEESVRLLENKKAVEDELSCSIEVNINEILLKEVREALNNRNNCEIRGIVPTGC